MLSPVSTHKVSPLGNVVTQSINRVVIRKFFWGRSIHVCRYVVVPSGEAEKRSGEWERKWKFIVSVRHKHSRLSLVNFAFFGLFSCKLSYSCSGRSLNMTSSIVILLCVIVTFQRRREYRRKPKTTFSFAFLFSAFLFIFFSAGCCWHLRV